MIKDFLVEAKPLDYISGPASKRVPGVDAQWTFSNGTQTFMLRAYAMRKGRMQDYRAKSGASLYVLSIIDPKTGKVTKRINAIQRALGVVTTVGHLITKGLADNIKTTATMFRMPSSMGNPDRVVTLAHRLVKAHAPQFEVAGSVEVGAYNYIVIVKRGTDPKLSDIFGVDTDLTVYKFIQEPNEEVSTEIEKKLEPQIKVKTPARVSIVGAVGTSDVPENAADYILGAKSIADEVRSGKHFGKKSLSVNFKTDLNTRALTEFDLTTGLAWTRLTGNQAMEDELQALIDDGKFTIDYVINNAEELVGKLSNAYPNVPARNIQKFMQSLTDKMLEELSTDMEYHYSKYHLDGDTKDKAQIMHYTGGGYSEVNDFLLTGEDDFDDAAKQCEKMDQAFSNLARYIDVDTVYRSMEFKGKFKKDVAESIPGKLFYFRPWVSTSLSPYLGWGFNAGRMNVFTNPTKYTEIDQKWLGFRVKCAMNIHGVTKVPVVVPGSDSKHVKECEVILPRGTTLRVNSCYGLFEPLVTGGFNVENVFWDMDIVAPGEILEEVYDGDALLETGELVLMSEGLIAEKAPIDAPTSDLDMFRAVLVASMGQSENASREPGKYKELDERRVKFNTRIM